MSEAMTGTRWRNASSRINDEVSYQRVGMTTKSVVSNRSWTWVGGILPRKVMLGWVAWAFSWAT